MSAEKPNLIKNPNRGKQLPPEPYEPEYRRLNRDPMVMEDVSDTRPSPPRIDISPAKVAAQYTGVLDKISQDFASVDGITVDESGKDVVPPIDYIIDNNEFIDYSKYNPKPTSHQTQASTPVNTAAPEINEYILMIRGKIVQTGELQSIESKVSAIIYGEDKEYIDASITDIVVLKRIPIKVGVFIG